MDVSLQPDSQTREYCMDLVSLETQQENDYIQNWLESRNLTYTWTSGRYVNYQSLPSPMNFRLCDFDGCDRPDFFPKNINGWFWSANQVKMGPTNGPQFRDWSHTGGAGRVQPDNREQVQQGGEEEACMAVLNNFYGDG